MTDFVMHGMEMCAQLSAGQIKYTALHKNKLLKNPLTW